MFNKIKKENYMLNRKRWSKKIIVWFITIFSNSFIFSDTSILNVSYDPTRELYTEYNGIFKKYYKQKTGQDIKIEQSHGGSGKQARSVIDGLEASIITLALAYDIDAIQKAGLIKTGWANSFPNQSLPYTSTIVFVVRKGNPKNIKDWSDLIRPGVEIVTPNPKTSGGARWAYLAAWVSALKQKNGNEIEAQNFVKKLFANVKVLDTGARGSTTTFAFRGIGDILITWENEAYLTLKEFEGKGDFEIISPSVSIIAEPPVAIVDKNVDKKGTRKIATEYLQYLYSKEAQEIIARNYYRPFDKEVFLKYSAKFGKIKLFSIQDVFGNWDAIHKKHFADGGIFDKIQGR